MSICLGVLTFCLGKGGACLVGELGCLKRVGEALRKRRGLMSENDKRFSTVVSLLEPLLADEVFLRSDRLRRPIASDGI